MKPPHRSVSTFLASPEKETGMLRNKLGPPESSEPNCSGSVLTTVMLSYSLDCSLIHCNLCSNSSLKLWQICWIYPEVIQWRSPFRSDLPGAYCFSTQCTNSKFQIWLVLKLYKKRCFIQMDEIYFIFLLVMKFIHCLIHLRPRLRRSAES